MCAKRLPLCQHRYRRERFQHVRIDIDSRESNLLRPMKKSRILLVFLFLSAFLATLLIGILSLSSPIGRLKGFSEFPIQITDYNLNDLGIVDANQDGNLDLYTTNHSAQQSLLIGNGQGKFTNEFADKGLSQDREFDYLENSNITPEIETPGLYIYRKEGLLHLTVSENSSLEVFSGEVSLFSDVEVKEQTLSEVSVSSKPSSNGGSDSTVEFSIQPGGHLALKGFVEIPHRFRLDPQVPLDSVYIGREASSPDFMTFDLMWRDRHSMAWADITQDGQLDVFVGRGGIKGKMHEIPEDFYDELFIQRGSTFADRGEEANLNKANCPGRQAAWIDYDQDNLLDIYHACGRSASDAADYPNQLFHQTSPGVFVEVAEDVGLALPRNSEFLWLDADQDGDQDLIVAYDKNLELLINDGEQFEASLLGNLADTRTKKFSPIDYDLDGDLDVYVSGKKQNFLLVKEDGGYTMISPSEVGLPNEGLCGSWVDYNNDGLTDFYALPNGLYEQTADHQFKSTGLLKRSAEIIGGSSSPLWGWNRTKLRDARCSWFDFDNDGARDLVVASENVPSFRERLINRITEVEWKTALIHNEFPEKRHWLEINLQGESTNPQAIGAIVKVTAADQTQMQQIGSSEGAYFSQGHYRLYFGLGKSSVADKVEVLWPDAQKTTLTKVDADQRLTISA